MNKLSIKKISKSYDSKKIVSNVSIEVNTGEVIGLLGPNGAGKTTCFYMITGLISPGAGKIYINEKNITNLSIDERANLGIGYLAQEPSIFRGLSVRDNILAILEQRQDISKKEKEDKLTFVGSSLTAVMAILTVAASLSTVPSLTLNVKLSLVAVSEVLT